LKNIFNALFLRDLKGQNSHVDSVKVTSDETVVNDKNTSGQKRGRKPKKVKNSFKNLFLLKNVYLFKIKMNNKKSKHLHNVVNSI